MTSTPTRKIVIFSGGSAANSLVDVFNEVIEVNSCSLSYVIPISDNGGSSSELIRVFGGPGIGDIRSIVHIFLMLWTHIYVLGGCCRKTLTGIVQSFGIGYICSFGSYHS